MFRKRYVHHYLFANALILLLLLLFNYYYINYHYYYYYYYVIIIIVTLLITSAVFAEPSVRKAHRHINKYTLIYLPNYFYVSLFFLHRFFFLILHSLISCFVQARENARAASTATALTPKDFNRSLVSTRSFGVCVFIY